MQRTIDWINNIIEDLTNSDKKLKDTLLKVQVLAFKLKNEKLQSWVNDELNGYVGRQVPAYRIIPTIVCGNLMQDRGFGGGASWTNQILAIEYLEKDLFKSLSSVGINKSVPELEHMVESKGSFQINLPHVVYSQISNKLSNNWEVVAAWQKISLNNIEGILNSVKSTLLTFVLQLTDEIGENENLNIMDSKKKVDRLFDNTFGSLHGQTINILTGANSVQSISSGAKANINLATGKEIDQTISLDSQKQLVDFINELKSELSKFSLSTDDNDDLSSEISRIETQLSRSEPKYPILSASLNAINSILLGVTGNLVTPYVEKLAALMPLFTA